MKNCPNCKKILNWIQDNAKILIVLLVCFGGYSVIALLFGNNWLWPWALQEMIERFAIGE
jgi:hypothetical protein